MYKKPPLQFCGNKFRFREEFINEIKKYDNPEYIYVDLFGGSGYLSYLTKQIHPNNDVIYNDFDNYSKRIANIKNTEKIIDEIKELFIKFKVPIGQRATKTQSNKIIQYIRDKELNGEYIDYMTLSSQLCFSNWICKNYEMMENMYVYNRLHKKNIKVDGYLDYLGIVSVDWKELYDEFKNEKNIVWIIDPPYLGTIALQYNDISMKEVLEIADILFKQDKVIYFCSNTSNMEEIIKWKYGDLFNRLYDRIERENHAGGITNKRYKDIMLISKNK